MLAVSRCMSLRVYSSARLHPSCGKRQIDNEGLPGKESLSGWFWHNQGCTFSSDLGEQESEAQIDL